MVAASRGEMPKKAASKVSTESRKPPRRTPPVAPASPLPPARADSQRPAGTSVTALEAVRSRSQKAAGSDAIGSRHDSPTTAMASVPSRSAAIPSGWWFFVIALSSPFSTEFLGRLNEFGDREPARNHRLISRAPATCYNT